MRHLKIFILIVGIALGAVKASAQDGWVTITHGRIKSMPMKNAVITSTQYRGTQIIDYFPALKITSTCDSVFSLVTGVVKGISSQKEEGRVFIKVADSLFYIFSQLRHIAPVEGQLIKKGDFIGLADKTEKENLYATKLQIITGILDFKDEAEMWVMVKENN